MKVDNPSREVKAHKEVRPTCRTADPNRARKAAPTRPAVRPPTILIPANRAQVARAPTPPTRTTPVQARIIRPIPNPPTEIPTRTRQPSSDPNLFTTAPRWNGFSNTSNRPNKVRPPVARPIRTRLPMAKATHHKRSQVTHHRTMIRSRRAIRSQTILNSQTMHRRRVMHLRTEVSSQPARGPAKVTNLKG